MTYIKSIYFYLLIQFLSFATEKKPMKELKHFLLPLQFLLSLLLLIACLYEVATSDLVLFNELCKALSVVACVSMLHAVTNEP